MFHDGIPLETTFQEDLRNETTNKQKTNEHTHKQTHRQPNKKQTKKNRQIQKNTWTYKQTNVDKHSTLYS